MPNLRGSQYFRGTKADEKQVEERFIAPGKRKISNQADNFAKKKPKQRKAGKVAPCNEGGLKKVVAEKGWTP